MSRTSRRRVLLPARRISTVSQSAPTVRDMAAGGRDQVFIDPSGDPNTAAHSVAGPNGTTALSFDGADDRIDFGPALLGDIVGVGRDFAFAFRYKSADPGAAAKTFFRRQVAWPQPHIVNYAAFNRIYWRVGWGDSGYVTLVSAAGVLDGQWLHVACRRRGQTLTLWVNGAIQETKSHPDYAKSFAAAWDPRAIGQVYQSGDSNWPFAMAGFRAYDRALGDEEIAALSR